MNKNSLTYRFLRGYAIGVALAGTLYILPHIGTLFQLLFGVSIGILAHRWYKEKVGE